MDGVFWYLRGNIYTRIIKFPYMTFTQKTKRFLEPIILMPKNFFWNFFEWAAIWWYYIFSFEMLRRIVEELQSKNIDAFYQNVYWYLWISVFLSLARLSLYKTGWTPITYDGAKLYYKKYLQIFIAGDGNEIEKIWTWRFITILQRWVYDWLDAIWEFTYMGVTNIIISLYSIYFVFTINIWAWWIALILMSSIWIIALPIQIWMRKKRMLRYESEKEANHQSTIVLMSKNELLQNNGLEKILWKIFCHFEDAKKYQYPVNIGFLALEEIPRLLFLLLRVGLYIYIARCIFQWSETSFTDFTVFVTVIAVMEKSINELFNIIRVFLRHLSGIEQLWSTFDSLTPIKWYDSGKTFSSSGKNIEIQNISYGYNETKVLEDFSLSLESGKKVALVGASWGWKTTLMKLIAGYLHPEAGSISVLGNRLDETALKTYYPHIGYLTQEPGVFDATIRENLVSALPSLQRGMSERQGDFVSETTEQNPQSSVSLQTAPLQKELQENQLIKALKLAHCDFVFELEKWLDTEIGERGVRLSGGQKQRLAIAKIFLKNPEIILLDEPTSALDSFSEEQITIALDELFRNRTVIIVAHRLQTVKKADDIIVLEQGKIVERGNHESLVAKNGIYNRMLELQSGF